MWGFGLSFSIGILTFVLLWWVIGLLMKENAVLRKFILYWKGKAQPEKEKIAFTSKRPTKRSVKEGLAEVRRLLKDIWG